MKIVLVSYSQDVSIADPDSSATFLVIGDEATGASTRIPVAEETVVALTEFVEAVRSGSLQTEDHQGEAPEELEEEEEAPPPPAPAPRKTMQIPAPRLSVRQRLAGPPSEDGVPSL
jgi:hypothetical protein